MPSQWKYLPRTLDICAMYPFAKVLDAGADVTVTAANFKGAFRQLPGLLSAGSDARKLHAHSLIKIATSASQPASSAPKPGEIVEGETASSSNSSPPDALDLATAVFICKEVSWFDCIEPYLFGWDNIAQHHCKPDLDLVTSYGFQQHMEHTPALPKIYFSPQGSEIAAAVVRAIGLESLMTKLLRFRMWMRRPRIFALDVLFAPHSTEILLPGRRLGITGVIFVCSTFLSTFPPVSNAISPRSYIVM